MGQMDRNSLEGPFLNRIFLDLSLGESHSYISE